MVKQFIVVESLALAHRRTLDAVSGMQAGSDFLEMLRPQAYRESVARASDVAPLHRIVITRVWRCDDRDTKRGNAHADD